MSPKTAWRWLAIAFAFPAGGFCGFVGGYYLCYAILWLQGRGNSHADMLDLVVSALLGVPLGAVLVPLAVWLFTRRRRK
jgi:hypothetical protein